jgi:hypothetical protein
MLFFVSNFVAGAVELVVADKPNRAKKRRGDDMFSRLIWFNTTKIIVGYV